VRSVFPNDVAHSPGVRFGGLVEWAVSSKLVRELVVEIRIGVSQSMKEIDLDLGDVDRETVLADITKTLADDDAVLWLTDKKGRSVGVPASKVAYVEVGAAAEERKVGFAR
jgi:Protein of unknown function (DUF3107)